MLHPEISWARIRWERDTRSSLHNWKTYFTSPTLASVIQCRWSQWAFFRNKYFCLLFIYVCLNYAQHGARMHNPKPKHCTSKSIFEYSHSWRRWGGYFENKCLAVNIEICSLCFHRIYFFKVNHMSNRGLQLTTLTFLWYCETSFYIFNFIFFVCERSWRSILFIISKIQLLVLLIIFITFFASEIFPF